MTADQVRVSVQLFGSFRRYAKAGALTLEVPRGTSAGALRPHLAAALRREFPAFADEALLERSVLADDDQVLADGHPLGEGAGEVRLALLPPVCGG